MTEKKLFLEQEIDAIGAAFEEWLKEQFLNPQEMSYVLLIGDKVKGSVVSNLQKKRITELLSATTTQLIEDWLTVKENKNEGTSDGTKPT